MVTSFWVLLAVGLLLWSLLWFLLSLPLRRMDIADVAWGLGFILVIALLVLHGEPPLRAWAVFAPAILWGARLALHIGLRLRGKGEDFRYRHWREEWGRWFLPRSYAQVFLLQTAILAVVAAPLLVAGLSGAGAPAWSLLAGGLVWLTGFVFQAVGDAQLARFRRCRAGSGEILDTGLWRYSRHPNYFGEILMWWGLWLMVLPLPWGWLAVVSPLTVTGLLVRVSGVPMLEKRFEGHSGWAAYKAVTPALVPWGLLGLSPRRRAAG